MSEVPLKVVVIVGSTREGRFGPTVARWFVEQAESREEMAVEVVDLAEARLPTELSSEPAAEAARLLGAVTPRLAEADAFVVVTPEYNHSYPASLKNVIDWHFSQWRAKPVGFVSYGGVSGGLRAVEHLRQVFAELHAVTVRDTVSFHGARQQFDDEGRPSEPDLCNAAAKRMLDALIWWGRALRTARSERPYVV
jgi:NAD(P)H-dependent FMN reductase